MPRPLSEKLLALAAKTAEGGEAVRRALADLVSETAPFDAGEIVTAPERYPLGALSEGEVLAAPDLLGSLASVGSPLRFDDWEDMGGFPGTLERLRALGLRSLLALPFGGGEAALILARRQGWGFAGAPVPELASLARMAGLALGWARDRAAFDRRVEALRREIIAGREEREAASPRRAQKRPPGR